MERIFFIFAVSLLFGSCVAIIAVAILHYFSQLEIEKKFKERSEKVSEIYKKGIVWNFLFIAGKIGELVKKIKYKKIDNLATDIKIKLEIMGSEYLKVTPYAYIGVQILLSLAFIVIAILILDIYNLILLLIIGAIGFYLPLMWIKEKVKSKHKAIFRQIPDVLDMLTLMVEAGLDFNTSLSKIIALEKGRLIDEFSQSQQEIKLGKSRVEAFESLSNRIKYQPLTQVINALTLGIKTGGSLAPTLRTLSEQFRVERSQLAEKMAQEAPIKLMGPLVLLIFPTIFIVLFGPIILSFMGK